MTILLLIIILKKYHTILINKNILKIAKIKSKSIKIIFKNNNNKINNTKINYNKRK